MTDTRRHRTLVFHIGDHKTGTTSIQDALSNGRIHLDGREILYPARLSHNYLEAHFETYAKHRLIRPGSKWSGHREPNLREISARLAAGNFDFAVLSGEAFERSDPEMVFRVLGRFMLPHVDSHMVLDYVRPHAARFLSTYAERLKNGRFDGSFSSFRRRAVQKQSFIYAPRLASWRAVFGENFVVRPMVREVLRNHSVVDDFAATVFGAATAYSLDDVPSSNPSLTMEDLAILSHLSARLPALEGDVAHRIAWEFARTCGIHRPETPGTRLGLDKANAEAIRAACLEDAQALDRDFFAATPVMQRELDRAVDTAIPAPQPTGISDYFAPEAVRALDIYADMLVTLMEGNSRKLSLRLHERRIAINGTRTADQPGGAPEMATMGRRLSPKAGRRTGRRSRRSVLRSVLDKIRNRLSR